MRALTKPAGRGKVAFCQCALEAPEEPLEYSKGTRCISDAPGILALGSNKWPSFAEDRRYLGPLEDCGHKHSFVWSDFSVPGVKFNSAKTAAYGKGMCGTWAKAILEDFADPERHPRPLRKGAGAEAGVTAGLDGPKTKQKLEYGMSFALPPSEHDHLLELLRKLDIPFSSRSAVKGHGICVGVAGTTWSSIQINWNTIAKKHRDGNNLGPSIILGFRRLLGRRAAQRKQREGRHMAKALRVRRDARPWVGPLQKGRAVLPGVFHAPRRGVPRT